MEAKPIGSVPVERAGLPAIQASKLLPSPLEEGITSINGHLELVP